MAIQMNIYVMKYISIFVTKIAIILVNLVIKKNAEEMTVLENHWFATILVKELGKSHQGMLKHAVESLMRNKIFTVSTNLSTK